VHVCPYPAASPAVGARIGNNLSLAFTGRTCLRKGKKALIPYKLPSALAGSTDSSFAFSGFTAGALAGGTFVLP